MNSCIHRSYEEKRSDSLCLGGELRGVPHSNVSWIAFVIVTNYNRRRVVENTERPSLHKAKNIQLNQSLTPEIKPKVRYAVEERETDPSSSIVNGITKCCIRKKQQQKFMRKELLSSRIEPYESGEAANFSVPESRQFGIFFYVFQDFAVS